MSVLTVGHHGSAFGAVISVPESSKIPSGAGKRRGIDHPDSKDNGSNDGDGNNVKLLLIGIMITLIVFVLVISVYDVIKESIIVRETKRLGAAGNSFSQKEVDNMNAAAEASYNVAVTFVIVTFAVALLFLPPLFYYY